MILKINLVTFKQKVTEHESKRIKYMFFQEIQKS